MSDINKFIGSGRLARDTELRYTANGSPVLDFCLCSNRVWTKNGEKTEETLFVDVTLWGKQAESLSEYLKKGTHLNVEGRLQLDKWETDDGAKRSKIKVVAEKINLTPRYSSTVPESVTDDDEIPI